MIEQDDGQTSNEPGPPGAPPPPMNGAVHLGHRRFVYASYLAGSLAVMLLVAKALSTVWTRLAGWQPDLGEPRDEVVTPVSIVCGVGAALYCWKRTKTRAYVEEVSSELSKVTWPGKKEVVNSTAVVIGTAFVATAFFFLMDRFWGYVTNLVYGTGT